jgi:hypothetical protein
MPFAAAIQRVICSRERLVQKMVEAKLLGGECRRD